MLDTHVHPYSYKLGIPHKHFTMQQDNPNSRNFNKTGSIMFTQGRKTKETLANNNDKKKTQN